MKSLMSIKKIKKVLKVKNSFQLFMVMLVFAITGSLSVYVSIFVLNILGLDDEKLNFWIYWFLRILIIFPIYQILLIFIAALMGQFEYFWKFEKKILKRIGFNFK